MVPDTAIALKSLSLKADNKILFEDFTLGIARGEKITLTGRSGCGKSSLLKCILGFLRPDRGHIEIEGERIDSTSIWRLRSRIAYLPQEPEPGPGKVSDVLARPFTYKINRKTGYDPRRAASLFDKLLLPQALMKKHVADLSGGEKQRVAMASALLLNREILLMDEASSALDRQSRMAMAEQIRSSRDLTVLSVSHDPEKFALSDNPVIDLSGGAGP